MAEWLKAPVLKTGVLVKGIGGSNPSLSTTEFKFVRWCNGSTRPFGGFGQGSSPCWTANFIKMKSEFILNILNDGLEKDPTAMLALISTTVPTNKKIAESYDIKIHKGYIEFGLLSILNKIIEDEEKRIVLDYDVDNDCIMNPKKFIIKSIKNKNS